MLEYHTNRQEAALSTTELTRVTSALARALSMDDVNQIGLDTGQSEHLRTVPHTGYFSRWSRVLPVASIVSLHSSSSSGSSTRRGGDRGLVCDLRTRLVQWVQNAASQPGCSGGGLSDFMYVYLEDA